MSFGNLEIDCIADSGTEQGRELLLATSADGVHWQPSLGGVPLVPTDNFADTNTALLWVERLNTYVVYGRTDSGHGYCPHAGTYKPFREVAAVQATNKQLASSQTMPAGELHTRNKNRSEPQGIAGYNFSKAPDIVFESNATIDPGCVDFYNPAPVDMDNVTFLFPAASLHLLGGREYT